MKSGNKILIVDDSPTNIRLLMKILEDYIIEFSSSGEEALLKAAEFKPDLILLDVIMPGMSGHDVCQRLRSEPYMANTKIIMVSAKIMLSERLKGYRAGADDYITKPFEVDELLAKVKVYLRLKSVEEVDQLKDNLIKLLRLEINNPLNCIVGPIDMLLNNENLTAKERVEWLGMIKRGATSLQDLFEKIETLSIMKSGKRQFFHEPADLCTIVEDVITKINGKAISHDVKFNTRLPKNAQSLLDRSQIGRVIEILLDNAIRFSHKGGKIQVEITRHSDNLQLLVSDEGIGIDPDFIPYIFDEFNTRNLKKHGEGHGLSLAIVRHIIEEHQGQIEVESHPGLGTTFTVQLPHVVSSTFGDRGNRSPPVST